MAQAPRRLNLNRPRSRSRTNGAAADDWIRPHGDVRIEAFDAAMAETHRRPAAWIRSCFVAHAALSARLLSAQFGNDNRSERCPCRRERRAARTGHRSTCSPPLAGTTAVALMRVLTDSRRAVERGSHLAGVGTDVEPCWADHTTLAGAASWRSAAAPPGAPQARRRRGLTTGVDGVGRAAAVTPHCPFARNRLSVRRSRCGELPRHPPGRRLPLHREARATH